MKPGPILLFALLAIFPAAQFAAGPASCALFPSQLSLAAGSSMQVSITCYDSGGNAVGCPSVQWSSSIGYLSSESSSGALVNAGTKAGAGTITARATYQTIIPAANASAPIITSDALFAEIYTKTFSCSTQLMVKAGAPSKLVVTPSSVSMYVGVSKQFSAALSDAYGNTLSAERPIYWSISGGIGTIDQNGLFSATSPGNGAVTATYSMETVSYSAKGQTLLYGEVPTQLSGSAQVSVIENPSLANACELRAEESSLRVGKTTSVFLTCYSNPPPGSLKPAKVVQCPGLSWVVDGGKIDSFPSEEAGAKFIAGTEAKQAQITVSPRASAEPMGYFSCGTKIAILPGTPVQLSISPTSTTMYVGDKQQFSATGYDEYKNAVTEPEVFWSVSGGIGSVDGKGLFSAAKAGSGTVQASLLPQLPTEAAAASSLSTTAAVSVSARPEPANASGGSGTGGGSGSGGSSSGGGSFASSSTVSFTCAGKEGSISIKIFKPGASALAEIFYMEEKPSKKVLSTAASGSQALKFTPEKPGVYSLHVTVSTEQRNADFYVPPCLPSTINVTKNLTVDLSPPAPPKQEPQPQKQQPPVQQQAGAGQEQPPVQQQASGEMALFGIPVLPLAAILLVLILAAGYMLLAGRKKSDPGI